MCLTSRRRQQHQPSFSAVPNADVCAAAPQLLCAGAGAACDHCLRSKQRWQPHAHAATAVMLHASLGTHGIFIGALWMSSAATHVRWCECCKWCLHGRLSGEATVLSCDKRGMVLLWPEVCANEPLTLLNAMKHRCTDMCGVCDCESLSCSYNMEVVTA